MEKGLGNLPPTDPVDLEVVLFEVKRTFSLDKDNLISIWIGCLSLDIMYWQQVLRDVARQPPPSPDYGMPVTAALRSCSS